MSRMLNAARANVVLGPIGAVLAATTSVLVARWLGPDTYADYAMLLAVLAWLLLLGEAGCNFGLQRYLADAGQVHARRRLYDVLQWRRWGVVLVLVVAVSALGPVWAASLGLPSERWDRLTFGMVGVLAGVTLHAQLATSCLLAGFDHLRAMTTANVMTILRAAALGSVCVYFREPVALVAALLAAACIEAALLHVWAVRELHSERSPLPPGMANAAQRHGLVGLIDKITTAFTAAPFLLLVLAAFHGRAELAMFAVATDVLQRVLAVVFLPISNLVIPMLNDSRGDRERFVRQVERLGGLVTLVAAFAVAGLAAAIPAGFPLLFGAPYAGAVPIALMWLAPLFIEASIRMIWGHALLALDHRRWLLGFNVVAGISALLVVAAVAKADVLVAVAIVGTVRLAMAGGILVRAAHFGLLPAESRPLRVVAAAMVALTLSWLAQSAAADAPPLLRLSLGLGIFAATIAAALHLLPLLPKRSHEVLRQLAGRHGPLFLRLVPRYRAQG
ncbi:MAG: oligosaccharide flippase family protein [Rhizobiales bacterium]|nr:oligosaccharide flippase family protein [Hyphomicrobiales bacterium]